MRRFWIYEKRERDTWRWTWSAIEQSLSLLCFLRCSIIFDAYTGVIGSSSQSVKWVDYGRLISFNKSPTDCGTAEESRSNANKQAYRQYSLSVCVCLSLCLSLSLSLCLCLSACLLSPPPPPPVPLGVSVSLSLSLSPSHSDCLSAVYVPRVTKTCGQICTLFCLFVFLI